jgi:type I restriction enzyme, S subunit
MEKNKLPEHWQIKKLGEVFTIERGGSPRPIEDYITTDDEGINWIKIGDTKNVVKYIVHTKEKIKPEGSKKSRMVYVGDFILSNSMSFGRPYIMKTTGCIHDGWLVIRKNETIDDNYLYLILGSSMVYKQFSNLAKGSTVKNLNIEAVKQVSIPLPPLPEQLAIVSKLEELLSDLENGRQQLITARQQLKIYRQSLLKAAFEGKLSLDYDSSDSYDSYDLIQESTNPPKNQNQSNQPNHTNHTNQKNHSPDSLPKGWKWVKNKELLKYVTSGSRDWKKYYSNKGSRFVRTQDINSNKLELTNSAFVDLPDKVEGKRSLIEEGDILMTITGANVGKVAVVDFPIKDAYVSQSVALLKYHDKQQTKFLWYYFQAQGFGKSLIEKLVYGVGRPVLSLENMRDVDVLICPKKDQKRIIDELECKLTVCDKIEETINDALEKSESLRQSILQKAFTGQLTDQINA